MKRLKVSSFGKFALGRLMATPGALRLLERSRTNPADLFKRHVSGDWGILCADDAKLNDAAVHKGGRIMSVYRTPTNEKLWVITEADRSATTILLPEEY